MTSRLRAGNSRSRHPRPRGHDLSRGCDQRRYGTSRRVGSPLPHAARGVARLSSSGRGSLRGLPCKAHGERERVMSDPRPADRSDASSTLSMRRASAGALLAVFVFERHLDLGSIALDLALLDLHVKL
jgi:hypothetical protein